MEARVHRDPRDCVENKDHPVTSAPQVPLGFLEIEDQEDRRATQERMAIQEVTERRE